MKNNEQKKWTRLGAFINKERQQIGLSLRKFAEKVGVTHVAISHIEKGRVEAKKETLIKIASILNYDKDTLLAGVSMMMLKICSLKNLKLLLCFLGQRLNFQMIN